MGAGGTSGSARGSHWGWMDRWHLQRAGTAIAPFQLLPLWASFGFSLVLYLEHSPPTCLPWTHPLGLADYCSASQLQIKCPRKREMLVKTGFIQCRRRRVGRPGLHSPLHGGVWAFQREKEGPGEPGPGGTTGVKHDKGWVSTPAMGPPASASSQAGKWGSVLPLRLGDTGPSFLMMTFQRCGGSKGPEKDSPEL